MQLHIICNINPFLLCKGIKRAFSSVALFFLVVNTFPKFKNRWFHLKSSQASSNASSFLIIMIFNRCIIIKYIILHLLSLYSWTF